MIEGHLSFTRSIDTSMITIVSSDAFLNETFFTKHFPKAKFIRDRFHLLKDVKERVTLSKWSKYSHLVTGLIYAKNETIFNESLQLLLHERSHDTGLVTYFTNMAALKETYADYILQTYEGNLGMKGSSIAEQNNSSVLNFINDLTQSRSVEDLVTLLLKRQLMKEKKSNEKLIKDSLILKQEISSAKGKQLRVTCVFRPLIRFPSQLQILTIISAIKTKMDIIYTESDQTHLQEHLKSPRTGAHALVE
jgi:hypothetical protein